MNKMVVIFLTILTLTSCDGDKTRYKVLTDISGNGDDITIKTAVYKFSGGSFIGSQIYYIENQTSTDSVKYVIKKEKAMAYNFVNLWLETQNIKDALDISEN